MKKTLLASLLCMSVLTAFAFTEGEQIGPVQDKSFAKRGDIQETLNGPAVFRENVGQWDNDILYKAHSKSTNVTFFQDKLSFRITKYKAPNIKTDNLIADNPEPTYNVKHLIWNVEFVNSNNATVEAEGEIKQNVNYFKGDVQATTNEYGRLNYYNIYNNIDLTFYTNMHTLKYDFVVNPGGNIQDIILDYKGVEKLVVNRKGQLLVKTEWGDFVEDKPFSYQIIDGVKKEVKVKYDVKGNTLRYKVVGKYNKNYPLIIDPSYDPIFEWGTYFGGDGVGGTMGWAWTYIMSVDIDNNYDIYVTGMTTDDDQATPGVYDASINGTYDGFIAKLNDSASEILFFTYFGGSSWDMPTTIRLGDNNNIFIYGTTQSTDLPTKNPYQANLSGTSDVFIAKFNSTCTSLLYSTYVGGGGWSRSSWGWIYGGVTMSILPNGDVACAGMTNGSFPTTSDANDKSPDGGFEGFYFRLSADGTKLVYSTYLASPGNDYVTALTSNAAGEVYVGGYSDNADFPYQAPAYRTPTANLGGGGWITEQFGFFCKFSTTNKLDFSGRFGGNGLDWIEDIKVLENGEFYICGRTASSNFPIQNFSSEYPVVQDVPGSGGSGWWWGNDAFVSKFSPDGSKLLFSTYLGGNGTEINMRISTNTKHEILVTGMTTSTDFPIQNPGVGGWNAYDAFIVKLSRQGHKILFGDVYGGNRWDFISSTRIKRINCSENIVFGGFTWSNDIPTKPWVIQPNKANDPQIGWAYQGFLAKYRDTLVVYPEDIDLGIDFVFCDNINRRMDAGNPGASYLWNTGDTTRYIVVNDTGEYSVNVTYGCGSPTKSDTVHLGLKFTPQVNLGLDSTHCNSINHPLFGKNEDKPEATFKWFTFNTNDEPTLITENRDYTAKSPGTYWLNVQNYCGIKTDSIHIRKIFTPTVTLPNDTTHCGPVFKNKRLNAFNENNDAEYEWSTGETDQEIIVYDEDLYWVEVTNKCGSARDEMMLYNLLPPELDLGADDLYCNEFSRKIDAGNGDKKASYLWYPTMETTQEITVTKEGEYSVEVNNLCGVARDTVFVNNLTTPVVTIPASQAFCLDVEIDLDAGNENNECTYEWYRTGNQLPETGSEYTATDSGTYYVIVENVCGIDTSNFAFYTIIQKPDQPDLGNDTTYCGKVPARILYAANEEHFPIYTWYKNGVEIGDNSPELILNGEGTYKVNVSNQCEVNGYEDDIYIGRSEFPVIEIGRDTNFCGEFVLEIEAEDVGPGAGPLTYKWLPTGETSKYIVVTQSQTYSVKATNEFGCVGTDYLTVTEDCPPFVYVPNAFTPDDNGINEVFKPSYEYVDNATFIIYNRWGEVIFKTENMNEGWDGTIKGEPAPAGQYIWTLFYTQTNQGTNSGNTREYLRGKVILIR